MTNASRHNCCPSPKLDPSLSTPLIAENSSFHGGHLLVSISGSVSVGSGHQAIALENLALRRQLAAFQRKRKRPILTKWDRMFWIGLSRLWAGWKGALVVVQPETVLRWQRARFRRYWAALSRLKSRPPGRPALAQEVRRLIFQMATANPTWGAPRIHGELKMLGIVVSERTVSRVLRTVPRPNARFSRAMAC